METKAGVRDCYVQSLKQFCAKQSRRRAKESFVQGNKKEEALDVFIFVLGDRIWRDSSHRRKVWRPNVRKTISFGVEINLSERIRRHFCRPKSRRIGNLGNENSASWGRQNQRLWRNQRFCRNQFQLFRQKWRFLNMTKSIWPNTYFVKWPRTEPEFCLGLTFLVKVAKFLVLWNFKFVHAYPNNVSMKNLAIFMSSSNVQVTCNQVKLKVKR